MMVMLVAAFFSWWYGPGWTQVARNIKPRLLSIANGFSVNQLLRTLFSPWRRIITYPGNNFNDRLRAWGDNVVSRIVGFVVRSMVLLGAGIAILLVGIWSLLELVLWPLLPLAIPGALLIGLTL